MYLFIYNAGMAARLKAIVHSLHNADAEEPDTAKASEGSSGLTGRCSVGAEEGNSEEDDEEDDPAETVAGQVCETLSPESD
jgi:hypothetical protein